MEAYNTKINDVAVPITRDRRWRVLHKVPPQVRGNKKQIFEPVVVTLGPYHHGRLPEYELAEQLKKEVQAMISGHRDKDFLLSKVYERLPEIRHFYGGAEEFHDEALAAMMLRDTCFLLMLMERDPHKYEVAVARVGMAGSLFIFRDVNMVENQIPLWLLSLIISLLYDAGDRRRFMLCNYLVNVAVLENHSVTELLPWERKKREEAEEEEEPLHLLAALHRTRLLVETTAEEQEEEEDLINKYSKSEMLNSPFRSATEMKAKGIHFRPTSRNLRDIKFYSFSLYGQLHLPTFIVTPGSKVYLSNLVAYEMSPETKTDYSVTSYVSFMKTLIEGVDDVKVLREKGVLYSTLASDEEVVRMFIDIDTLGYSNFSKNHNPVRAVKIKIEEHCSNKANTWMADLFDTYFSSPWTVIALFAAVFILCLTFVQTYYTVRS